MDSLTQAALGAATFALVKDKDIGNRSMVLGAIAGTIPDLDVLLSPFYGEIEFLRIHRGFSHSIPFIFLSSWLLAHLFHRLSKKRDTYKSWFVAFLLAIGTHALLDCCTTYGTRLFYPAFPLPISFNNIFVADPLYTLPLLIPILLILVFKRLNRQAMIRASLIMSSVYMLWTFAAQGMARSEFKRTLDAQGIKYEKMMVSPTPLNSVLWNGIVKADSGYYFGHYSLFDSPREVDFRYLRSYDELIPKIKDQRLIQIGLEFAQGYPMVRYDSATGLAELYAVKFGPITLTGKPEFFNPIIVDPEDVREETIGFKNTIEDMDPTEAFGELWERAKGI